MSYIVREDDREVTINPDDYSSYAYSLYSRSRNYRRHFDGDWDRYYRFYAGRQWEGPVPEWKTKITVNFIFSTIESIVPILTDTRPQITVVPQEPSDTSLAELHAHIQRKIWEDNDMDIRLPTVVRGGLIFGNYFVKPWWDSCASGGLGDVRYSLVDPFHVFPSPGATSIEDASYVAIVANVPLKYVYANYPDAEGKIVPGVWDNTLTILRNITSSKDYVVSSADPRGTVRSQASAGYDLDEFATMIELWEQDHGGRVFLTVCVNGVTLRGREPSPYNYQGIPLAHFINYQIPGSFWGMSEVQQLIPLQESINRRRSQVIDILRITAQPTMIVDENSGVNPMAIAGRPGAIIYKTPGSSVQWLQPPAIPSALFEMQFQDKRDFEAVSGVYDVTQGRPPVGVEAAAAILALQEASQNRLRLKARNLEAFIRKLGTMSVSIVQQFYTTPRVVRLTMPNGTASFITVNGVGEKDGVLTRVNDITAGKFDLQVGAGSTLPTSRAARAQQMKELYQLGVVDKQAVLEYSGIPREEAMAIIRRMSGGENSLTNQGA